MTILLHKTANYLRFHAALIDSCFTFSFGWGISFRQWRFWHGWCLRCASLEASFVAARVHHRQHDTHTHTGEWKDQCCRRSERKFWKRDLRQTRTLTNKYVIIRFLRIPPVKIGCVCVKALLCVCVYVCVCVCVCVCVRTRALCLCIINIARCS